MNPMVLFHRPEGLIKVMQVFFNQSSLIFCSTWEIFLFTPILIWTAEFYQRAERYHQMYNLWKVQFLVKHILEEYQRWFVYLVWECSFNTLWNKTSWRSPGLIFQSIWFFFLKPVTSGCCGQVDGLVCLSVFKLFSNTTAPRDENERKGNLISFSLILLPFCYCSFLCLLCVQK